MSKKIWLINHYAVPPMYYPLARTSNFAKYLIENGFEVTIFTASTVHNSDLNLIEDNSKYRIDIVNDIKYVYVKTSSYKGNGIKRIINMFQFPIRLKRIIKNFAVPDVILASSAPPMTAMAGISLGKRFNCRTIIEVTDLWPESIVVYGYISKHNPLTKYMYHYEKKMYTKAQTIIFSMEGGRDYIIEKGWDTDQGGPIDLTKVYHINNGVDLEQFNYNKEHYFFADEDLDNPDLFKIVYTGSIRKANNIGLVLDVAKLITNPKIKFLIWGSGTEQAELEKRIINENITNVVFKGRVDKKYIPSIVYRSYLNFFVLENSDLFRFGLSLNKSFDYLASGKPLLIVGGAGYSMIDKYSCGIHVKNWCLDEFADAVERLFNLANSEYQQMCNNALLAAEEYDFKNLTSKLIRIINNI